MTPDPQGPMSASLTAPLARGLHFQTTRMGPCKANPGPCESGGRGQPHGLCVGGIEGEKTLSAGRGGREARMSLGTRGEVLTSIQYLAMERPRSHLPYSVSQFFQGE